MSTPIICHNEVSRCLDLNHRDDGVSVERGYEGSRGSKGAKEAVQGSEGVHGRVVQGSEEGQGKAAHGFLGSGEIERML